MLINEDYFKDIEISDNDIYDSENTVTDNEYDPESLFNYLTSRYSHCMTICVRTVGEQDIYKVEKLWENLSQLFKRLNYLLNLYGIEYSEPIFLDKKRLRMCYKNYNKFKIFDFKGFKVITIQSHLTIGTLNTIYPTIYFNLPEFNTLKNAYKFIVNLTKIIWYDNFHKTIISNKIQSSEDSLTFFGKNPFMYINRDDIIMLNSQNRLTYNTIRTTINYFSPENKNEIDELYKNNDYEQLLDYIK